MARNKLSDLNDHLMAQMERLGEEGLTNEQMELEAKRSKAMIEVSKSIVENARLTFQVAKAFSSGDLKDASTPKLLKESN